MKEALCELSWFMYFSVDGDSLLCFAELAELSAWRTYFCLSYEDVHADVLPVCVLCKNSSNEQLRAPSMIDTIII